MLLLLTAVTVVGGYAFLRYAYRVTDRTPFTQEIVLIILGTLATVLITALLLNKQTAVEIEKEQSLKFIELKTRTYEQLIDRIEEMSLTENITERDLIRMQFITHRLAIFSSPPVLKEFHHFLEILQPCARDAKISDNLDELSKALANLTVKIRADLIGDLDMMGNYTQKHIRNLILRNSDESMELKID
ncbi:MAG: hypothetical protein JRJ56_08470 [Deltaproteobacteria bacterium]|nr:hypothetical protein [Deltaproteobacteria bacterium]